jgi:NADH-quinone oxidoreductase subunit G
MVTVYIEGRPYQVDPGQSMLQACFSLGFNVPYFCWHPAMGSVGACRQCAVKQFKDEKDTRGKIVMSCMTPASEGTRISIADPQAARFRAGVIEGLMQSHPHDCPVCDEGGECHLQDMTVLTGHAYRRYRFAKRTFRNQYLGPFLNHEMNRCIQCYRCVRFYREYAGGDDFHAFSLRNKVYFGRTSDGALENEFSGNLVEVCPTGVFTDATLKQHYTRKWDLQMAPSVCAHCGVGCNITLGERYGTLRRALTRYNVEVNGYFICDRGRYAYEYVNSAGRIRQPLARNKGAVTAVPRQEALDRFAKFLGEGGRVIGIGSPRASLESNFVLRSLVGPDHFFNGMTREQAALVELVLCILREGPARSLPPGELERADAVLVLGEDLTQTAPRLALSARQSVRQKPLSRLERMGMAGWLDHAAREAIQEERGLLLVATPAATKLDDVAQTYRAAPDDVARLGAAIARAIDPEAPAVEGLPESVQHLATQAAAALRDAERPAVIAGLSLQTGALIQAAANVANALSRKGRSAGILFVTPECNSLGVGQLAGNDLEAALQSDADTVIILENDLFEREPPSTVNALFKRARHLVSLDSLSNPTTRRMDLVLPAATYAESGGTLVNSEGRAQRFFSAAAPQGDIQESWRWLRDAAIACGKRQDRSWQSLDTVIEDLVEAFPGLGRVRDAAPSADFRMAGQKVPRQPHRFSGRTAIDADRDVHEPKSPEDSDSALAFTMEGTSSELVPAALKPFSWSPNLNSIQAAIKFQQEVNGPLFGGPAGVRLIEPRTEHAEHAAPYFDQVPAAFRARRGEWLAIGLHHIFGSDELSRAAPAIAQRLPEPAIALSRVDAERLGVAAGALMEVEIEGESLRLMAEIRDELPEGVIGIPVGTPPIHGLRLPAFCRMIRVP